MRLRYIFTLFAAVVMSQIALGADLTSRPNIIFILIDDLRWDEVDYPFVKVPNIQRIAREGVRFRNAFVTTPLCSPSRASYLTGQYAHKHGITDNRDHSPRSHELVTFLRLLHDSGFVVTVLEALGALEKAMDPVAAAAVVVRLTPLIVTPFPFFGQ